MKIKDIQLFPIQMPQTYETHWANGRISLAKHIVVCLLYTSDPKDIQVCYFANTNAPNNCSGTPVTDALKLHGIPVTRNENWCTAGHIALINACLAVQSGMCDIALAIGAEKLKDKGAGGLGVGRGLNTVRETRRDAPGSFALIAERYFKKYNLTYDEGKRLLAKIDIKNHFNGSLTPKAHFHNVLTMEQVMNANLIASPHEKNTKYLFLSHLYIPQKILMHLYQKST